MPLINAHVPVPVPVIGHVGVFNGWLSVCLYGCLLLLLPLLLVLVVLHIMLEIKTGATNAHAWGMVPAAATDSGGRLTDASRLQVVLHNKAVRQHSVHLVHACVCVYVVVALVAGPFDAGKVWAASSPDVLLQLLWTRVWQHMSVLCSFGGLFTAPM